ncbi:GNAT family N-acetyltransferase [Paenibacillus xylaniclasticus]|uniref:GNAT family N-acetyltransferase n=1 Tax=Paenibacillus xylaniclasticus TaxID=588083 RepID=UPI0013DEC1DC|nr:MULTISPECIES: GNAT family N-acetyltransferase [Paenibacillus]GFN32120.1 acetyltransferase [Paenibacillus curdlanolyticus]
MQLMVEEMMMNAWPALRTVVYEGWFVRFSNGYTKRSNAVYPLYGMESTTDEALHKIAAVERLYAEQGQPAVFKITDAPALQKLDEELSQLGYCKEGLTAIMTRALEAASEPTLQMVEMSIKPTERWLSSYTSMSGVNDEASKHTLQLILERMVQPACYFTLYNGERDIACAFAVLERDYVGIYGVVTDSEYRNQGYGEQLMLNVLKWARLNGAAQAYLAVVLDNVPAVRLYNKVGFVEQYRYWYRMKDVVK